MIVSLFLSMFRFCLSYPKAEKQAVDSAWLAWDSDRWMLLWFYQLFKFQIEPKTTYFWKRKFFEKVI